MESKFENYRTASLIAAFATVFFSGYIIGSFGSARTIAALLLGLSSCLNLYFSSRAKKVMR